MHLAWIKEPIEILGAGLEVWEERKKIRDMGVRAIKTLLGGRKHVAVFGIAGTGKTTLGELLTGKLDPWSTEPLKYVESPKKEIPDKEEGTVPLRVWVAPGQARSSAKEGMAKTTGGIELLQMLDKVGQGDFDVIVNVVSWGYAAFHPAKLSSVSGYEHDATVPMSVEQTNAKHLSSYVSQCRDAEVTALERVVAKCHSTKPERLLFLTVVAKADLWWEQRDQVQKHYNAVCSAAFKGLAADRGQRFESRMLAASLVRTNLRDKDGQVLAETARGYDDWRHLQQLHDLFHEFETALS